MNNKKANQIAVAIDFVRSGISCKDAALITALNAGTVERAARKAGLSKTGIHVDQIPLALFNLIKASAAARALDFAVTAQDLADLFTAQHSRCALSGDVLEMRRKKAGRWIGNASLDRIDSSKGYVKGNLQWVTKAVNFAKQQQSQKEFIDMCKKVASHRKEK